MAKACAYLCRQCCFIDGFGEFGEKNLYDAITRSAESSSILTKFGRPMQNVTLMTKISPKSKPEIEF